MTNTDRVKDIFTLLLRCRRDVGGIYLGDKLIAHEIGSFQRHPIWSGSRFPRGRIQMRELRDARNPLYLLGWYLVMANFESHPFLIGKDLAQVDGRLVRRRLELSAKIIEKDSAGDLCRHGPPQDPVKEALYGADTIADYF